VTGRPPFDGDEEQIVREMTRELELLTGGTPAVPAEDFADRVMTAIADEPLPQPVRAFGLAVVAGRFRAAAAAVGDSWRVATSGFAPAAVRAQAFALVLVVAVATITVAGGATVGAINLLSPNGPTPTPAPTVSPAPSPSPSDEPVIDASTGPTPSETVEPTETPEPTGSDDHGGRTPRPTATGTDDHGGGSGSGSGSGSGGSGSGSGSDGSGDHTPEPTDDHSGGGGGGGDG
jgi:hypothetical protein